MKASKFKEGDIVRIRQWDDMVNEFGIIAPFGSIGCMCAFTTDMKELCGKKAQIIEKGKREDGAVLIRLAFLDGTVCYWTFSTDMIEPAKAPEDEDIIDVESEELQPVETESDDMAGLLEELGGLF